jgi:hypothetical protein
LVSINSAWDLQLLVGRVVGDVPPVAVVRELVVCAVDCFVDGFDPVVIVDVPVDVGWNLFYDEFRPRVASSVL